MCGFKPREIIQETSLSWFMHQNVNEASFFFSLLPVKLRHSRFHFTSLLFFCCCHRNQGASQSAEEAAIAGGLQIPY